MATIFRGPTYAQQHRRAPVGSGWTVTPRLLTTLVLVSAVPFQDPVQYQIAHPSHRLTANPDTSRGTPKTLYADAVKAFTTPHQTAPDRRRPVVFDSTQDLPLTLLAGLVQAPLNVSPWAATPHRRALNWDASRGVIPTYLLSQITGTLATTNANDTLAASGAPTVSGSLAQTNADDTSAAAGSPTVTGSLAYTNADDTSDASGGVTATVDSGGGGGPRKKKKHWQIPPKDHRRGEIEEQIARGVPLEDGSLLSPSHADIAPVQRQDDDDELAFILTL